MNLVAVVLVVVVLAVLAWGVWVFNCLVSDRNLVSQAYADIDVQLKRRSDLVPPLVEAVRGYAAYERQTLQAVTESRRRVASEAQRAPGPNATRFGVETQLGDSLKRLILLQESYPALQADSSFRDLAANLVEIEDALQSARRFYNGAVKQYVTRLQTFPDLVIGGLFSFKRFDFFGTDDRAAIKVAL